MSCSATRNLLRLRRQGLLQQSNQIPTAGGHRPPSTTALFRQISLGSSVSSSFLQPRPQHAHSFCASSIPPTIPPSASDGSGGKKKKQKARQRSPAAGSGPRQPRLSVEEQQEAALHAPSVGAPTSAEEEYQPFKVRKQNWVQLRRERRKAKQQQNRDDADAVAGEDVMGLEQTEDQSAAAEGSESTSES